MNTFTPSGYLTLVKVPLEKDYNHQLDFNSLSDQTNYFNGLTGKVYEDYTYIKKDNQIRVDGLIDTLLGYNYLFYRNNSGKTYYCFIDKMTYLNDNCTLIDFSTDVIQTYLFDMDLTKESLIEREHCSIDSRGGVLGHQYPEQLEHGDYIYNPATHPVSIQFELIWVVAVSDLLPNMVANKPTDSKIPDGLYYIGIVNDSQKNDNLNALIKDYTKAEKLEAIYSIFLAPLEHFSSSNTQYANTDYDSFYYKQCETKTIDRNTNAFSLNNNLPGYTPRNEKLLDYEYNFLQISNHNGSCYNYDINSFADTGNIKFRIIGSLSVGGSYFLYPINYKGYGTNYDEGITLGKFPVGSFVSDTYLNWLTQNSLNVFGKTTLTPETQGYVASGLQAVQGVLNLFSKDVAGGVENLVGGGIKALETYNEIYHHKQVPDQVEGNTNCGDALAEQDHICWTYKQLGIKPFYSQRIDDYFDHYGYKVNEFKAINLHTRTYWNFIKTIECNVESLNNHSIPQEYIEIIKSVFNKGITFWHNPVYFMDYTQTNSIIRNT